MTATLTDSCKQALDKWIEEDINHDTQPQIDAFIAGYQAAVKIIFEESH